MCKPRSQTNLCDLCIAPVQCDMWELCDACSLWSQTNLGDPWNASNIGDAGDTCDDGDLCGHGGQGAQCFLHNQSKHGDMCDMSNHCEVSKHGDLCKHTRLHMLPLRHCHRLADTAPGG